MEKITVEIGFALICGFFFLAMMIDTVCLWGCVLGLLIMLFGWFFWDE